MGVFRVPTFVQNTGGVEMTCPECDSGMDENFKGNPGGPTMYFCRNCGLRVPVKFFDEESEPKEAK